VTNKALADPKRHVVLEANPELIPRLTENRDLNRCGFQILNRAVGYGGAEVSFFLSFDTRGGGIHNATGTEVRVPAITLEQVARDFGFSRCTLICDIEGAEVDVVEKETPILAQLVDTFILEIHPAIMGPAPINSMLETLKLVGFEVIHSQGQVLTLRNRGLQAGRVSCAERLGV
jgi:FkbM family methyltransferase